MGIRVLFLVVLLLVGAAPSFADSIVIKLGTMAPEGSVWHDGLLKVRQTWRDVTAGEVELRIYGSGVLGGEAEMVRKLQRRGLDAVAITGAGLPRIDRSVDVLNIPLLFESYAELDHVRGQIAPALERHLEARGFKVLSWSDAGWVYFFTKRPVRKPDELRSLRLWISSGAPESERLFKQFGFQVVPLPATEMLTALQTGLVEAIDVPPLFALLDRSYQLAGHMIDIRWAPLNAATIISLQTWNRIPSVHHDALLAAIRRIALDAQAEIRSAGAQAVVEMQARGLEVIALDAETRKAWQREARASYPILRENADQPELFDRVLRLSESFKKANPDSATSGR